MMTKEKMKAAKEKTKAVHKNKNPRKERRRCFYSEQKDEENEDNEMSTYHSDGSQTDGSIVPQMPRVVLIDILHPVRKDEEGCYKASNKTKIGDIEVNISDWFCDEEQVIPIRSKGYLGVFRRRVFKEANAQLGSLFSLGEQNFSKMSKLFYFETNGELYIYILCLYFICLLTIFH